MRLPGNLAGSRVRVGCRSKPSSASHTSSTVRTAADAGMGPLCLLESRPLLNPFLLPSLSLCAPSAAAQVGCQTTQPVLRVPAPWVWKERPAAHIIPRLGGPSRVTVSCNELHQGLWASHFALWVDEPTHATHTYQQVERSRSRFCLPKVLVVPGSLPEGPAPGQH